MMEPTLRDAIAQFDETIDEEPDDNNFLIQQRENSKFTIDAIDPILTALDEKIQNDKSLDSIDIVDLIRITLKANRQVADILYELSDQLHRLRSDFEFLRKQLS